jgi:hypothetical protein
VNDLVTWLREQLDEDERIAHDASEPLATWSDGGPLDDEELGDAWWLRPPQGTHAARWDPTRVLAEVAAKRSVLDHFEKWSGTLRHTPEGWAEGGATAYRMAMERVLCLLASSYAGYPGYREQWRP